MKACAIINMGDAEDFVPSSFVFGECRALSLLAGERKYLNLSISEVYLSLTFKEEGMTNTGGFALPLAYFNSTHVQPYPC